MAWPNKVKDEVLVKCGRHCCICHKFCGIKIELHHIIHKSEGGKEIVENCIPLCFDCHADQRSYDYKHPKGTKYSRLELKGHRDKWYRMVEQNLGTGNINHLEQDKATFVTIFDAIPVNTIAYLREWDFEHRWFSLVPLRPLQVLKLKMENEPWIEFFDSDLESLRLNLNDLITEFVIRMGKDTFNYRDGNPDSQCIPREWSEPRSGNYQLERYEKAVKFFNNKADEIAEVYIDFVKLGRRKLGIIT